MGPKVGQGSAGKSGAGTSAASSLSLAACAPLPAPSSSQGDRGFDGQQGAKGDQGEKGDRVSGLERDGVHCSVLLLPGSVLGQKHIRARCSQKSHLVLL